jgi:hypothetical protein
LDRCCQSFPGVNARVIIFPNFWCEKGVCLLKTSVVIFFSDDIRADIINFFSTFFENNLKIKSGANHMAFKFTTSTPEL